ncbi:NHLP bacteriocin export ABC transporter permease/ATPase subunit [Cohnella fermenti]|uniref:NHLP bacteriocin export ABC transporter permease/ATPase subunit n=1 Tax=Cohnella fermenti TaxID=2565925 RepID=A0A4S4BVU9_9BACL|nr:NHLP bacteriocin export ABC transporter permease/ATPase subunit [Cohnella fermenti]THF77143.1 NHLP bacteriocin export ABC transporter permease/ATPase subunit [Cohnella fermenti]
MTQSDYAVLEQFFAEHGEVVHAGGNAPLVVMDESSVWYIRSGHVDVFAVTLRAGEAASGRRFLLGLNAGRLVFGYHSAADTASESDADIDTETDTAPASDADAAAAGDAPGHLVVGTAGTVLLRADRSLLFAAAEATTATAGAGGEANENAKLQAALSGQAELWVQGLAAALKLADRPPLLSGRLVNEQLTDFHRTVHLHYVRNRAAEREAERQQLKRKREHDRAVMEQALKRLAAVTDSSRPQAEADSMSLSGSALYAACKLLGESVGIKVKPPSEHQLRSARDPVALIAAHSGFRTRQVDLKGRWWLDDNGSLLGFMEGTQSPVALIRQSSNSYILLDPEAGTEQAVTEQIARTIAPAAYMLYRPLPIKPLKVMDLAKFCWHPSIKRDLGLLLLMGLVGGVLGMFMPIASGLLFDTIIPASDRGLLLQMGFILLAVTVSLFLFQLTQSMALLRLEGRLDSSIQAAVWDRLLSLPVSFFRDYSAGDLSMRASSINAIRQSLSGVAVTAIFGGIFSSFNFFLLFYYDMKMALVAAAMVAVAAAVTVGFGTVQVKRQRVLLQLEGKLAGTILQLINGIAKFRMAAAEKRAFFIWAKQFGEIKETDFRARTLINLHAVFNVFFPAATSIVLFYMVATGSSTLSPGGFIAFFAAFTTFLGANLAMSSAVVSSLTIIPLYERARPILETIPEAAEVRDDPGELAGEIEVKHVRFRYKEDQPLILQDMSLHVRPGEFVALVGASGCGKSTLMRLLLGFDIPESGSIAVDGQDLKTLDIRAVRRQFGVVLQNGKVMSGDIFTNIAGSSKLTIDEAWEAAAMAGLDEDIRQMPMGMHTMVAEGGSTLSGGQRQRMLIARAIAGKPKVLLFDEATSALDNRTQAIVSRSLEALKATRIVIAHRLSTIRNADRIFVFDKGHVVQSGTYEELMEPDGLFRGLAERQLS